MFFHNQQRIGATLFVVLFASVSGMLVRQSFGQTVTGTPGTALTNAVINFGNLATNSPVLVQSTTLTSSPPAITFQAQDDGGTQDPPFPGGAVGPNHVVSMLDNSIRIQKRDGTVLSTITLQQFWAVLGPYADSRGAFDGKVLYDPYKSRWITTAVADYNQPTSSTLIGVSQTSDPTGNWNLYRVAASTNGDFWVNYPSFGFNTNWVAVSVTAFPISSATQESQLYVFDKADLYAGGLGHYTEFEFSSTNQSTFGDVQLPAATYDSTQSNLYMLAGINGNTGGNGALQILFVTGAVGSEVVQVGSPISTPNPWDDHSPAFPFAPQLGSSQLIGLDDSRLGDTIYRNGAIWTAHTIFLPAGGSSTRSAIQWWQIRTDGTILQRGRLDDPTGNLFYGYPSIAVNQNDDALIGYARFSASNFPSAYFDFRAGTDPTNTLQGEVLLKAGEAPFERSNRWGDHTSTVVDPANDTDMWTIQEYSASPLKGVSLWGTWWGDVLVGSHVIASNAVVVSESCSPINSVVDPFEHAAVQFSLLNIGGQNATNVVATLLATGGVTSPSVAQSFGTITAGGTTNTSVLSFLADASCGSNILATLQLQSGAVNLGTVSFLLPVGTPNGVFTQNFDSVTAPALPVGWSTDGSGVLSGWITTNSAADSAPNAAFCPDTNDVGEARLVSPSISITSSNAQMIFRNNYDLELGYDGGVLEIAVGAGAFQDIVSAGGTFEQGGYSHIISTNATGSSLVGLAAWSGNSGGWITTTVNLPAAAAGQNIQLRWRCVTDNSGGGNGWLIDSVEINDGGNCCTAGSEADLAINESVSSSPVLVGSNLTYTITVTNNGPGIAFSTTVTDTPPSSVVFLSATPSQGTCATDAFGTVICNLQDVTNGTAVSISVIVDTISAGSLTNIARAGAFSPDPNLANNTTTNIDSVVTAAPTAAFTASPTNGAAPLLVNFTDASTGTITNHSWTFGDGNTSAAASPSHSYSTAGVYSVALTVLGPGGSSSTNRPNLITVTNVFVVPVAAFTASPTNGAAPLLVNFTDASTGTITNHSWTFGDGNTSAAASPSHSYSTAGVYSVALTVLGPGGSSSTNRLNLITVTNVFAAPVAAFTASPTNGAAPLLVNFTDASTGTITNHSWTFGDGNTSAAASPSHSYSTAGVYSVALTVLGPGGSSSTNRPNLITVTNVFVVPVAAFTASPTNGAAPLLVNFTDASTGTITNHSWTFGDGGTSILSNPSHTYTNRGVYPVTLTVTGPSGSSTTNRPNLITVTNALNTPPTVTIVRPGNGMLYPATFTNQTITIVVSATPHDGAAISRIQFLDGTNLIGEATSSPGTNFLVHPALGAHVISARASEAFGTTNISAGTTITIGAKNSPLGDWEVTISGADKGVQFLTFEDDYSASGFGIRLKTFGLDDVSSATNWAFAPKGKVAGLFIEETGSTTNWTGTLLGTAKSLKSFTGTVLTASGVFRWKGVPATGSLDLSGTWTGVVTIVKVPTSVSYAIRTNANDSAVFDITTTINTNTVIGQLIETSREVVYGYVAVGGTNITMSGKFKDRSAKALPGVMTFKGTVTNTPAEKVSIQLSR